MSAAFLRRLEAALPSVPSAPAKAGGILLHLRDLDAKLVASGFPSISPWWWQTLEAFYQSAKRQLVLRVGRRGGKSSTLCRVAVCEALYGGHPIPRGDVGMFAFVSINRQESRMRLRTVMEILTAIGEPFSERGDEVELERRRVLFRVFTASITGVSGPTCIGGVGDELAKWRDANTGANPATEVLNSWRPTMVTQPRAKLFLSSSPMGELDAHASAMREGDTAHQMTRTAPTWVANPSVAEPQTHELEPNEDVWRREYAAIPMEGTEESMFSSVLLDGAERADSKDVPHEPGVTYNAAMDPALVRNAWTLAICGRRLVGEKVVRSVVATREWRGTSRAPLRPDRVLLDVARVLRTYDLDVVDTDEFHGQSLQVIAERTDINLVVRVHPTTAKDKIERYESLLTQLSDKTVELPKCPVVRADLLAVRRVLTPNGFVVRLPETPDGRHCDHASSITLGLSRCLVDPEVAKAPYLSDEWKAEEAVRRAKWEAEYEERQLKAVDEELEAEERERRSSGWAA